MKINRFLNGCDTAIFIFACGQIYFLPIATGLTEWGNGLILMTFLVKRTVVLISRLKQPKTALSGHWLKTFVESYRPAGWFLNLPLLVFAFACVLATVFSQDYSLSIKALIFKWLEGILVYCGFMEGIKSKKQIKILLVIFIISAGLVGINGLFQRWQGEGFMRGRPLPPDARVCSTLKHSNDFSGYLITVFAPALTALCLWYLPAAWRDMRDKDLKSAKRYKMILLGLGLIGLVSVLFYNLGLTFSRGGWLGFGFSLGILAWFRKRMLIPALILLAILVWHFIPQMRAVRNIKLGEGAVPPVIQKSDQDPGWFAKFKRAIGHYTGGGMGREGYWREALHMIRDYPVFGAGLNTYSKLGERYKINWGGYPHNCFLHLTAEMGLVGLAAFLWILIALFSNSFRHLSRIKDPVLYALLLGYLAGFSGFMLQSLLDTNIYSVQLGALFWLILAMIVKIQQIGLNID